MSDYRHTMKQNFLNVLVIIMIILNSGYAMVTMSSYPIYLNIILCIAMLPTIIKFFKNSKLDKTTMAFFTLIFMVVSTYAINGMKAFNSYLMYIMNIIIGFAICIKYPFKDITKVFLKIMTIVSICSLVGFFLANFTTVIQSLPTKANSNGVLYNLGYIFFSITVIPNRNCGIFWEPGLYACFLILALVFEIIFKEEKTSLFRIILYITCVITTESAAGYALLFFIIILMLLKYIQNNNNINKILKIIIIILLFAIFLSFSYMYIYNIIKENKVLNRLDKQNLKEESRYIAINENINKFLESPIGGVGIVEANKGIESYSDTSTSTYFLSVFGILGAFYSIFWIYAILNLKDLNILIRILLMIIVIIILNVQPHRQILFSWCLLFALLKLSKRKIKNESYIECKK